MTKLISVGEKALRYRLECPLRAEAGSVEQESPVLSCAEQTTVWLLAEIGAGRNPTAAETRECFDMYWKQTEYFRSRDAVPPKQYRRSVLEGVRVCRRVRDLLWSHEILHPLAAYELPIGNVLITGHYMVLASRRRKKHAYVPYLRYRGVKIRPVVPDVVSFARWLDARNRWLKSIPQTWGIQSVGVLHYWINQELAAEHKPDQDHANTVLSGATRVITGNAFPVPGDHCLTCPTRVCNPAASIRLQIG